MTALATCSTLSTSPMSCWPPRKALVASAVAVVLPASAAPGHKPSQRWASNPPTKARRGPRSRFRPLKAALRVAVAMHTKGQRMYIVGNNIENGSGLYRSDDGGATWRHMAGKDTRISNGQGNYSSGVFVDSQNPDILYTMSTAMYRSTDGGVTFEPFKGAPGGEDYHKLWIDPTNGKRMLVGSDQGASVTLDNGKTWSLWYTRPSRRSTTLPPTTSIPTASWLHSRTPARS